MDQEEMQRELGKLHARYLKEIEKARVACSKAVAKLEKAETAYRSAHLKAKEKGRLVPSEKHEKLVAAITKATAVLGEAWQALRVAEEAYRQDSPKPVAKAPTRRSK